MRPYTVTGHGHRGGTSIIRFPPVGSGDSPAAGNASDIAIGADYPQLDERLVGGVRLVRVWNTALDATVIAGNASP